MRIGLDLDDVVANLNERLNDWHNETYGTSYSREDYYSYYFWDVWGGTREEAMAKVYRFIEEGNVMRIAPVKGAREGVQKLKGLSKSLRAITGRSETIRKSTEAWIARELPHMIDDVHFTNVYPSPGEVTRSKGEICLELGIELMIDDSTEFAESCSKQGIPVIIFDTPWNRHVPLPSLAHRAVGWDGVIEIAERIIASPNVTPLL